MKTKLPTYTEAIKACLDASKERSHEGVACVPAETSHSPHFAILVSPSEGEFYCSYDGPTRKREDGTQYISAEIANKAALNNLGLGDAHWECERVSRDKARAHYRGWTHRVEPVSPSPAEPVTPPASPVDSVGVPESHTVKLLTKMDSALERAQNEIERLSASHAANLAKIKALETALNDLLLLCEGEPSISHFCDGNILAARAALALPSA